MARILIVEDNAPNLVLMEYLLRAFGHETLTASNGARAVALAAEELPDLILMDLHMPQMDGYEALDRLRRIPALDATPVIAVTASAMVGDRAAILARGFGGYVAKPITPATFVAQIEQYLPRPAGGKADPR
jgi:CheY-like chemotaxis protein